MTPPTLTPLRLRPGGAFETDARSTAAVPFAEPGGCCEEALDFGKTGIARVVGRWTSGPARAAGHAGAAAGAGDRAEARAPGAGTRAWPGGNLPVIRGKPANHQPRERVVAAVLGTRGHCDIAHEICRGPALALSDTGAGRYGVCADVDAVIAAPLPARLGAEGRCGAPTGRNPQAAAVTMLLNGRTIGAAPEIDDHLDTGRSTDAGTPASAWSHVV